MSTLVDLPTRALSLTQPWAWAVLHAGKDIENRVPGFSHKSFRGDFWIHAAKGMHVRHDYEAALSVLESEGVQLVGNIPRPYDLPRGGIVGRARIVGILPPHVGLFMVEHRRKWHFPDQYGFILQDARPVEFVPCKGALGFWRVPPAVLEQLRSAE